MPEYMHGVVDGYQEAMDEARRLLRACVAEFSDHAGRCRGMDALRDDVVAFLKNAQYPKRDAE